jgi:hypothetical protein
MTDTPSAKTDSPEPCPPPTSGKPGKCQPLPPPPNTPGLPPAKECPQPCNCPAPPGGPGTTCLDEAIKSQAKLVKQADRAQAFVTELTDIQSKAVDAQTRYTQSRYKDLLKMWQEQDKAIWDLVQKLACGVPCWECLVECRLCPQLTAIRAMEQRLNGTGQLTTQVYSLLDLQYWQQRNVAAMQDRVDRINAVLSAWADPSKTLGDLLDQDAKLIDDTLKIIATNSAKAVYDVFMTLLPRHWAIRPRDPAIVSKIDRRFIDICKCDDGVPDDCCGPDAGSLSLRMRVLGAPLPYLVDPAKFFEILCCLAKERLLPASTLLASAQADLAATTAEMSQLQQLIKDGTTNIEATFEVDLGNPIDCTQYTPKPKAPPAPATPPNTPPDQKAS